MNEIIKETKRQANERKERENAYYVNRRLFFAALLPMMLFPIVILTFEVIFDKGKHLKDINIFEQLRSSLTFDLFLGTIVILSLFSLISRTFIVDMKVTMYSRHQWKYRHRLGFYEPYMHDVTGLLTSFAFAILVALMMSTLYGKASWYAGLILGALFYYSKQAIHYAKLYAEEYPESRRYSQAEHDLSNTILSRLINISVRRSDYSEELMKSVENKLAQILFSINHLPSKYWIVKDKKDEINLQTVLDYDISHLITDELDVIFSTYKDRELVMLPTEEDFNSERDFVKIGLSVGAFFDESDLIEFVKVTGENEKMKGANDND